MNRWAIWIIGVLIIVVGGYYLIKVNGALSYPTPAASSPPVNSSVSASPTPVSTNSVNIINMSFNPAAIAVKAGTTVTWTNNDSVAHTVTSDTGIFDSQSIAPGQSFSFTFSNPGTFPYHCTIHPYMQGTVVVS